MTMIKKLLIILSLVLAGTTRSWTEGTSVTLAESEQMALAEHPTLKLAGEETRVADLRKDEAYRGIWPLLSAKGEITEGVADRTLGTPDFLEESYGFQMTQSLIQGGRLVRGYKQAKAHWRSIQAKEEKARQEVLFNVRESFFNLVKAQRAEEIFSQAVKELEEDRQRAETLVAKDVISRQAHLTILGQAEQSTLNLTAAQAETESRVWQWTAALGRDVPPEERPLPRFPEGAWQIPDLPTCLSKAQTSHPDIVVQRFATEAARYGDLVGKSLYSPKLSANGFYGRSGAAYENENFEFKEDWNFGAQISQYFGGSSASASVQEIKTSPKLGQSTRTRTRTYAGNVGILDSLKPKTERAEAGFSYRQAAEEMRQTMMNVANGVRAAYADFAKARSQRRIAETDVALAKTDFDVARIRSANRELPVSERSLSRNRLAQAEASFVEAEAQLRISAAALARAVGDPTLFQTKDTHP